MSAQTPQERIEALEDEGAWRVLSERYPLLVSSISTAARNGASAEVILDRVRSLGLDEANTSLAARVIRFCVSKRASRLH